MACDCIKETNELLKEHNAALVTNLFSKTPMAFVETYILEKKRGAKAPKFQATFCPFCGVRYEPAEGEKSAGAPAEPSQDSASLREENAELAEALAEYVILGHGKCTIGKEAFLMGSAALAKARGAQ